MSGQDCAISASKRVGKLAVFTKTPESHDVKTRLAKDLGSDVARSCHQELVNRTIKLAMPFEPVIYFTGPLHNKDWVRDLDVLPQQGKDLGERMHTCFEDGIRVLIGTDCPMMSEKYIEAAFKALETNDLVLGPTEDGGYVLVGLNSPNSDLFKDVPWSTEKVLATTLRIAENLGLKYVLLPRVWDVDDSGDHARWQRFKRNMGDSCD